jgi:hypothetical protein
MTGRPRPACFSSGVCRPLRQTSRHVGRSQIQRRAQSQLVGGLQVDQKPLLPCRRRACCAPVVSPPQQQRRTRQPLGCAAKLVLVDPVFGLVSAASRISCTSNGSPNRVQISYRLCPASSVSVPSQPHTTAGRRAPPCSTMLSSAAAVLGRQRRNQCRNSASITMSSAVCGIHASVRCVSFPLSPCHVRQVFRPHHTTLQTTALRPLLVFLVPAWVINPRRSSSIRLGRSVLGFIPVCS